MFSLNRTAWIGWPGVPPTNTQGGVEKQNMLDQNEAVKQPLTIYKKEVRSSEKQRGFCFIDHFNIYILSENLAFLSKICEVSVLS